MTVLELARKAGFPPSVVRFYVRAGALRPHRLTGGQMGYDTADAERLRLLIGLRRAGVLESVERHAERATEASPTGPPHE